MPFSFDLTTDIGKVRLLIPDRVPDSYMFEDDEILAFLSMETGVKRASALALETIASDQVMVLKVIRLMDLTTDGAKVSDALLKRAAELRSQAEYDDNATDPGFDIAEVVYDDFSYRQKLSNEWLRDG